jgi:hypothetical protein
MLHAWSIGCLSGVQYGIASRAFLRLLVALKSNNANHRFEIVHAMVRIACNHCFLKFPFRLVLLIACAVLLSPPCSATIFTGSISRSDPPNAVLVARFNFREYTKSKYSVQASNAQGFFALFDDETQMLHHLEMGLSSSSSSECMSYLMDGKGVGPYRALPPAQLQHGWTEGIIGNYCRDWFFVFFNCQAALEVPSYRIEALTNGGSQLPCGKENLPFLLLIFAVIPIAFTVFMFQKHGRSVFDLQNSCCMALSGCASTGAACLVMSAHYFQMRNDGFGSHHANFAGRVILQAAHTALLLHAFRFASSVSFLKLWSSVAHLHAAKAFYAAAAVYVFLCIASLATDSSESLNANAQPLNACGRALNVIQLIFAAFATYLYRRSLRLGYADASFKLKCYTLVIALPWMWALPGGTLLCLNFGAKDQLIAVYAVQLSLTTVYSVASSLLLVDYVPEDDPQLFEEPRFFDEGL